MTRGGAKAKSDVLCDVNCESLKHFIKKIVEDATKNLLDKIAALEEQVNELRTANNQLTKEINIKFNKRRCDDEYSSLDNYNGSTETVIYNDDTLPHKNTLENNGVKNSMKNYAKSRKIVTGCANNEVTDSDFGGPKPQLWLHLFRCNKDTTEAKVASYLNKKLPDQKFQIFKLDSKGVYKSFRINTDYDDIIVKQLYNPEFWPSNVKVQRYRFFHQSKPKFDTRTSSSSGGL
ncbi:hypothetical protein Zmor_026747 [Zophobas morio]|uniref:Uncharacterized protein n=1 Tax=Zophobas morio TaxID=2755281 RepID=A0AA38HV35_9CUCU|nr:hypothetical protein Zmor_026747 [Zophobas morio]